MATPGGLVDKQELINAQLDTAHLGRVVNSKDSTGAPITTSTNRTGGVNKTLDALESEYQAQIDTLEARTDTAITDAESEFATQRDQFDATFQAQFAYKRIGNISDYAGQQLQEADKLNSYQYPDDSGEWYGPIQSQAFPITIPADPSASSGWALVNSLTSISVGRLISYTSNSVAEMISGAALNQSVQPSIGQSWIVLDYYGGANPNHSGPLFFKVVPDGTGTADGGKIIQGVGVQFEQNLILPVRLKAYGGKQYNIGDAAYFDNYQAITNCATYCKSNSLEMFIDNGAFYITQSVDLGGLPVRAEFPAWTDPHYAKKIDGTNFIDGTTNANFNYYYNSTELGRNTTWKTHLESLRPGAAIISDVASPIITSSSGEKFNIDGLGVIGNHRLPGQAGIFVFAESSYVGNVHDLGDVTVTGCGGNGINLTNGWEVVNPDRIVVNANNGYGLYVGVVDGGSIDSSADYINMTNCSGSHNRLGTFYFAHIRRALSMVNCYGNNPGQYASPRGIDPLLGYNRDIPTNRADMASLIRVNDSNLSPVGTAGSAIGLNFDNIHGEQLPKAIHVRCRNGVGVLRNLRINNVNTSRLSAMDGIPKDDPTNGVAVYLNCDFLDGFYVENLFEQALYPLDVESVSANSNKTRVIGVPPVTDKEFQVQFLDFNGAFGANSTRQEEPAVYETFVPLDADGVMTTNIVKDTHDTFPISGGVAPTSRWRLSATNEVASSATDGIYELVVGRNNRGEWFMGANELLNNNAFTSAPTIALDGTLSINIKGFREVLLHMVDNSKWIGWDGKVNRVIGS